MPNRADPDISSLEELASLGGLLEHRVRLAVCVLLSKHESMSFSRLKQVLGETDGNLGTHLRKLEDKGYVEVEKSFRDRRPVTWYSLSGAGRAKLQEHVANLSRLIELAR